MGSAIMIDGKGGTHLPPASFFDIPEEEEEALIEPPTQSSADYRKRLQEIMTQFEKEQDEFERAKEKILEKQSADNGIRNSSPKLPDQQSQGS
jgi:hypothetical protein